MERKDDEFKHWYLVSYKTTTGLFGHTHIGLSACWLPSNTPDVIKNLAGNHDLKVGDILIAGVFYMGYVPNSFDNESPQ